MERIIKAESARIEIEMMIIKMAATNAIREDVATGDLVDVIGIRTGMIAMGNVPSPGITSSHTTGRIVFSTRTVDILIQTQLRSFSTKKPMEPTRFTRTSTRTALKQTGVEVMAVKEADTKVVAEAAAGVEATKGGVDIKEAKVEAEEVITIKVTINKGINKEIIIKATIKTRVIIMIMVTTTIKVEVTILGLPRDKVKVREETTRVETKSLRAIISITLSKVIPVLVANALLDIWEPAGAIV